MSTASCTLEIVLVIFVIESKSPMNLHKPDTLSRKIIHLRPYIDTSNQDSTKITRVAHCFSTNGLLDV